MNNDTEKKRVILIGPILCRGGISTVINAVISGSEIKKDFEISTLHTTNYKDSNFIVNGIIFVKSVAIYLTRLFNGQLNLAHIHTSYGRSFYRKAFFVFLSSIFQLKVILHFHSGRLEEFFLKSSGIKKRIMEYCLKKSNAVVVLCRDWKEKMEKRSIAKNVHVINNPVPLDLDTIEVDPKNKGSSNIKILYLGFLIQAKGIYDILEISEALDREGLNYTIRVCGKGEEEKRFSKRIKDRNLHNVEFLGWIEGEQKIKVMKDSDIFLLPSYYEGMNNAILEAIAYGLPIVSTNVGGTPDIVHDEENGFLLRPGDINGMTEKTRILIKQPELRKKYGEKSRVLAKNLDKRKISKEWRILYQEILMESQPK